MKAIVIWLLLCSACFSQTINRRLLHYQGIGNHSVTKENPRAFPEKLLDDGWGWLYGTFEPMAKQGLRRWILWTPFGLDPIRSQWFIGGDGKWQEGKTVIRVDQFSNCRALGGKHEKLCDSFTAETKKFLAAGPDRELIVYLGMVLGAPEWTPDGSTDQGNDYSVAGLTRRMDAELKPYLDAGCSLSFDVSNSTPKSHWFYGYMQNLKKNGTKIYIEAWPAASSEYLAQENCIMLTDMFANLNENTIGKIFLDPNKITGEKQIWMVRGTGANGETVVPFYKKMIPALLANPHVDTVAAPLNYYINDGGKLSELVPDWKSL